MQFTIFTVDIDYFSCSSFKKNYKPIFCLGLLIWQYMICDILCLLGIELHLDCCCIYYTGPTQGSLSNTQ